MVCKELKRLSLLVWIGASSLYPLKVFAQTPLPQRWVSSSPQVTEILFQLGLEQYVVGTPWGSDYPESAKKLKRLSHWFHPNLELWLATNPDGVFWDKSSFDPLLAKRLESLGIESVVLELSSVDKLFENSEALLKRFGKIKNEVVSRARSLWMDKSDALKPFSFLALAWMDPPILFGKATFLYDVLHGLGGRGILPGQWNSQFIKISEEWMMAQNPQVVMVLSHDERVQPLLSKQCQKWWPQNTPTCLAIPAETFARASFTPLLNLVKLKKLLEKRHG